MKKAKNKPDPAAIFVVAEQYYRAAEHLGNAKRAGYAFDVRMPAIVCSAFALELFLKCLLAMDTGICPELHDLRHLFNRLPNPRQQTIRDRFAPHLDQASEYIFDSAQKAAVFPLPLVTFDYVLDMSRNAFPISRYIYEGLPGKSGWVAAGILDATRQTILSVHPEWARFEMSLGVEIRHNP